MAPAAVKINDMLNTLEKEDFDMAISYIQFLSEKRKMENMLKSEADTVCGEGTKSIDDILGNIVGVIPDTGKTLADYKEERIKERYGASN